MAITSMDGLIAGIVAGQERPYYKDNITAAVGAWMSLFLAGGMPGAGSTPPTGAGDAPTSATAGAIPFTNAGGANEIYVAGFQGGCEDYGPIILVDRLVQTSGLSGTTLTAQTVNTTALTRSTSAVGVECWLEQYTAVGSTARTATISYTNQNGTAGRSGTATIGGTGMVAGRMSPMSLQGTDTGVQSVQSVTLSASTGTAGNFGVTLLKRVATVAITNSYDYSVLGPFAIGLPQLQDNACLSLMALSSAASYGPVIGKVTLAEG